MWCSLFSDLAFTLGDCRGFAYIAIESTADNWKKCMSFFNGAKWKGMILKIQDAKPNYKQRHRNKDTMFAKDMNLVTDNNIDGRKKSKNHIIFSDNDLAPEVSDNFNLFDSDEEYNNNEKPTLGTEKII
ncbi:hypothetical protein C2G38_2043353 [Gigaspora rosea]|uniref:RRM domain-containing protein n=1 Tax=Gigaspora rosea TaxID=44941 RepID=A0A397UK54_9GLOM|nr:hypothetical protein C2G38_2043353 [Gigaspora rosea]